MITERQAIKLLKKYAKTKKDFEAVLKHSKAVKKAALMIAKGIKCDKEKIKIGALLHDIGRFYAKPKTKESIKHGIIGARILQKEGLKEFARFASCHIGAGITKKDIEKFKLPLPRKNYVPKTIEEKIIAQADNLVFYDKIKTLKDVINRFKKELGNEYAERVLKLQEEIEKFKNKKIKKQKD